MTTPGAAAARQFRRISSMKTQDIVFVALLMALGAALRLMFFNGLYGHDDWAYLFYARSFLNGQTHELLHSAHGLRFLLWLPIVGSFKLFGISYASAFLPGFLMGLATVPAAYACIRKLQMPAAAAVTGCVILLLNPVDWMVSTTIRGDIEMSCYGGALLLLLLQFRGMQGRGRLIMGAATGVVWGLSALTKEWGYVFAWGFFAIAAYDAIAGRRVPWEYAMIGAGFCIVVAADAALLRFLTGEWLARVNTSLGWYRSAAAKGGFAHDASTGLLYLPGLFAGLRNSITDCGRFVNGYPYYGIYMWLLIFALPLCLAVRGPARPVAWFAAGILLWIEFGSMSWTVYLPYHKEPRYFAIISVPAAVIITAAGARLWGLRSRITQAALVTAAAIVTVVTCRVVMAEHREYSAHRDFMPALVDWMKNNPAARLWTTASIQNELDLRFGYRFSDPVHRHAGIPGYGSVMDASFWREHQDDDYLLVNTQWDKFNAKFPGISRTGLTPVATLRGESTAGTVYRAQALKPAPPPVPGARYLSDEDPAAATQSVGVLKRNVNFNGSAIVLNSVRYAKGLGTHAKSELVYRLAGRYAVFSADIGLDDTEDGSTGSVVFKVYADGNLKYASPVMRWDSPAAHVSVDITGVSELKLAVENGGDGDTCDHASWADAAVYQERDNNRKP
jgi:hypothetical protein